MFDTLWMRMSTIVCVLLPSFSLHVQAWGRASLDDPVVLASTGGGGASSVLECSDAALAEGVRSGMSVTQALGVCAWLSVIEAHPERVAQAAERFLVRLERSGCAVHPAGFGRAYFDVAPLVRLYGGVDEALAVVRSELVRGAPIAEALRFGRGPNPFVAAVAARLAEPGSMKCIEGDAGAIATQLAPLPIGVLPGVGAIVELLRALGVRTLGGLAALPIDSVVDRFGIEGRRFHQLARGVDHRELRPRVHAEPVVTRLQFPEPIGSELVLQRAVQLLAERAVRHPRCASYAPRLVRISAELAAGGSWSERRALRTPTVDPQRIALSIGVKLTEIPSPVERLSLEFISFELRSGVQQELLDHRSVRADEARRAVSRVQEAVGDEAMLSVLELEPWSRMMERHAVLVPLDVQRVES